MNFWEAQFSPVTKLDLLKILVQFIDRKGGFFYTVMFLKISSFRMCIFYHRPIFILLLLIKYVTMVEEAHFTESLVDAV